MTLKKNLLLGALALGALAQTPVFAPAKLNVPFGIKTKVALDKTLGWFFNKPQVATYSTNETFGFGDNYDANGEKIERQAQFQGRANRQHSASAAPHSMTCPAPAKTMLSAQSSSNDATVDIKSVSFVAADKTNEKNICAIPLLDAGFQSPSDLAFFAVASALVARIIEGEASVTDYAKTAGYSFAGAMAASVLDDGTTWLKNKAKTPAKQMQSKPTENKKSKTAFQIGRFLQFVAFFAGQNPEVVKAMLASIKNGTAGKDLNDFILSLGKDSKQRPRIAAFVRNFGPHIAYMIHNI